VLCAMCMNSVNSFQNFSRRLGNDGVLILAKQVPLISHLAEAMIKNEGGNLSDSVRLA
jgi:hypothetical protein